jgi:DnaJ-domain-containing protein 1
MPYILLLFGLIVGIYALFRFFIKAEPEDIKAMIQAIITVVLCLALFILAVTGRLPAAIAIVAAIAPFVMAHYSARQRKKSSTSNPSQQNSGLLSREEALNVLGLSDQASEEDIQNAYKSLMKKLHPDQKGSEWMARKLNEARDILIKDINRP